MNLIFKDDGTPFATQEAAKAKRTHMGKEGLDTNIVTVDGGFALENKPYDKPKVRIPVGTRSVLSVRKEDKDPAYVYRFVNDDGDRIRSFRDAGWEAVEKRSGMQIGDPDVSAGNQLGSLVTKTVGKEKTGYLMRIKKEFYKEDQEVKAEKIRQSESDLKMEEKKQGRYGSVSIGERPKY
jgi:hypothetical protein